jgi:hypothetical protein
MEIIDFIGTCGDKEIGLFAERYGRKSSFNSAKKAIKNFSPEMYNDLALNFRTYYEDYTNIKTGEIKGYKGKFLHIVHSAIDYIFLIN